MGKMRDEWEPKVLIFANALASVVAERLEEKTGHKWLTSGDACFLNWSVGVRCEDCPRDYCMEFEDRLFDYAFGPHRGDSQIGEKHVELAVNSMLDFCAKKRELSFCHKMWAGNELIVSEGLV